MQHMQRPTCTNVRIRSTVDAHKIFYAVQQGILQMVTRRLDADERLALRSGCVYAWEERGPHTEITGLGIERFTEGRRWSPSRVRDEFLFYYEKFAPSQDMSHNTADKVPPRDWDPLVKQTYSVWVETPKGRRKWHLSTFDTNGFLCCALSIPIAAYFTQATVDQLGTIDDIDAVGDLVVPDGIFKSTRVNKNRKADDQSGRASDGAKTSSSGNRAYSAFPSSPPRGSSSQPTTPPGSQSLHMYEPYPDANYAAGYYVPDAPQYSVPPPLPPHSSSPMVRGVYHGYDPNLRGSQAFNELGRQEGGFVGRPYSHSIPGATPQSAMHRPPPAPYPESPYMPSTHGSPHSLPTSYPISTHSGQHRPPQGHTPNSYTQVSPMNMQERGIPAIPTRHDTQSPDAYRSPYTSPASPYPSSSFNYPNSYPYPPSTSSTPHPHASASSLSRSQTPPQSPPAQVMLPTLPPLNMLDNSSGSYPHQADSPTGSVASDDSYDRRALGPCRRVDLAPLHALQRTHPYRRDPLDDRTLRLLGPRSS
ncbi:hypothetical protein HGRIS_002945 [Hohenbuehelia grisea]|uniref:cAMP-independent regulatory protein pac2 n=1 Tax=Hohenbuehelia grisea TaxID=104357 RepID=A0ABR3JM09_9AGAR